MSKPAYLFLIEKARWFARRRYEKSHLVEGLRGISLLDSESQEVWEKIAIKPAKWRSGQYGGKGWEWVVAVTGNRCLYYNSVEEGWGWGSFSVPGIISGYHWQQDELRHQVHHTANPDLQRRKEIPELTSSPD